MRIEWLCVLTSLRPSTLHSSQSLIFHFIFLIFIFIFYVSRFGKNSLCASANEELDTLADNTPLTGYEPKKSSSDTTPSNLHDSEISDSTIDRALSSPLFTQEQEEPAGRRQAYHSFEESLLSSQSLSVGDVRTGRPVDDF